MQNFRLKVPGDIVSLIRNLHPRIKSNIKAGFRAILEDPHCGKILKNELEGLLSYRIKRYRIIYRIDSDAKHLEIIAIGPRRNIYEETFKLVSRGK